MKPGFLFANLKWWSY